jgi:hypothetical protein
MELIVDWTTLKAFATARSLSIQWVLFNSYYLLWAIDGSAEMSAQIPYVSPTPNPSDQYDFETNFQSAGNQSPRGNMVQVLGKDELTLCPFGAFSGTTLMANGLSVWDIPLPETMVLRGATFFSANATIGDWISVQAIDKDNITGQGGTPTSPTILGTYAISWYIMPGLVNTAEDVSISESLPQGIYMRINYNSVGTTAPVAVMNFISYVGG